MEVNCRGSDTAMNELFRGFVVSTTVVSIFSSIFSTGGNVRLYVQVRIIGGRKIGETRNEECREVE